MPIPGKQNYNRYPTYTPYYLLDVKGHTILSGVRLEDSSGNTVDLAGQAELLTDIKTELKLIRFMLMEATGISIKQEDITNEN